MLVTVDSDAKTLKITPQTPAEHEALAALGFNEGGDNILLVRQDIRGTSDLDFLQGVVTQQDFVTMRQQPKDATIPGPRA